MMEQSKAIFKVLSRVESRDSNGEPVTILNLAVIRGTEAGYSELVGEISVIDRSHDRALSSLETDDSFMIRVIASPRSIVKAVK